MKYIKKFSKNTDYQAFINGDNYITPNICYVTESKGLKFKSKEKSGPVLITFTINGTEYQAEEGMTFYDWAISEYFDSSCNLNSPVYNGNLRDAIIQGNISSSNSYPIYYGGGFPVTPSISTNTIIQPISYTVNLGGMP
jgi:hypothetical protein